MDAWPTIFVIRPDPEETIVKWPGSATTPELVVLLQDARGNGGNGKTHDATQAFLRGERAAAEEKHDEAIAQLRAALAAAPPEWPRRPQVVMALIDELRVANKPADCVELAVAELPDLPAGTARATVAVEALGCGADLPKKAKERVDVPAIAGIVARMAAAKGIDLLADDRSSLYEALVDWRSSIGDTAGVKSAATAWATFLESEAERAKSKEERAVFDSHRLLAYLALGDPARAIPMLKESEKDFPDDYNPPARLARVYFEMGRLDDALASIERALTKVYGPRMLRVASQEADILEKMGKKAEAKAAIEKALDAMKDVTLTGGYAKLAEQMKARAAKM
jgi:tetratricopeptide (TPR) repeat protein